MSRKSTAAAGNSRNLEALTNTEIRELLTEHGFPNQPVTNSTRNVLIARLRKSMHEPAGGSTAGTSKTRHTISSVNKTPAASHLARYSSAEEESDRESSRAGRLTVSSRSPSNNMPPPAATGSTSKRKRATQQGYSFFSPSTTSSVSYTAANTSVNNNNNYTVKVPIQPRSNVYIPPPTVHSSDTEESDSNTGNNSSNSTARNPYLSYGRLSGLSFPKRYSPAPESPVAAASNRSNTSNNSSGSSAGEESPYMSDFTKRLLQFRQEPVERRATTTASALPPPNPR